jgi:preprotein translocase subunit YajC
MANDKKNADVSSLLSDEEVDINSLISDEEVEISPKQDAPSANGGGNGAQNTPSSSSPLELSSWTTEANPYQSKEVKAPLANQKYEPSNFGEILEKAKIGVINPDLDIPMGRPATEKPKQDIDLLTKRTNVVRKLRDEEINKAKQLQLGLEQLQQKGAALNEQYKANPTPELEAELNQTVKDLQDTEKAYNRAAFAQDVYEKRIVQTSDSIKKLANDKVPTNVWEGLYSGIKGNVDSWEESYDLANMGKEEQIQYAKDQATKAPTIEASGGGGLSQMVGGVLPDIATAIGFSLVGLPAAGATTVAARQGAQQASEDFVRVFNEVKANGLPSGQKDANGNDIMREATDDEAYDLAIKSAGIGAATGFVEGMVGVAGSGKLVGALANKAKTQLGKKVAEKALDTAIDAGVAGTMQVSRNVFDRYQGLDTKITEGVAENMAGEALLSAPINTISGVGEYSKAKKETAVREVFKAINESKSNPYELQKLQSNLDVLKNQGLISDIDYNELNKKAEDYIRVVETIPTEVKDKQKAADLIIERDELDAKKESVDKAFQKPIDEKINAINEELVLAMQSIGQTDEKVESAAPKILSVSEISQIVKDKAEKEKSSQERLETMKTLAAEARARGEEIRFQKEEEAKGFMEEQAKKRDDEVAELNKIRPDLTDQDLLMVDISPKIDVVIDRIDANIPTDPIQIEEAISELDKKFTELEAYKKDPNRTHTSDQINEVIDLLSEAKSDLQFYQIENEKTKTKGEPTIKDSKGTSSAKEKLTATPEAEAGVTLKTETDGKERREEGRQENVLTSNEENKGVVEAAPLEQVSEITKKDWFHGTENDFSEFENKNPNITGFWFSDSKENAETYGKKIKSAKLNVKNPLIIDAKGKKFTEDIEVEVLASYPDEKPYLTKIPIGMDEIVWMVKNGKRKNSFIEIPNNTQYDAVVFKNVIDPSLSSKNNTPQTSIAVLDKNQIITNEQKNGANIQQQVDKVEANIKAVGDVAKEGDGAEKESKKADIERRRQEALFGNITPLEFETTDTKGRTRKTIVKTKVDENGFQYSFETTIDGKSSSTAHPKVTKQEFINSSIYKNLDQNSKEFIDELPEDAVILLQSIAISTDKNSAAGLGNGNITIGYVSKELGGRVDDIALKYQPNEINAKYDAELAALRGKEAEPTFEQKVEATAKALEGVKEQNYTQFAKENGFPDDYDTSFQAQLLGSRGLEGKRQSNRSIKEQDIAFQEMQNKKAEGKKAYRNAILEGKIIDPSGEITREGILKTEYDFNKKELESKIKNAESGIKNIEGLGKMAYLDSGKLKKGYQRAVDDYNEKIKGYNEELKKIKSEYENNLLTPKTPQPNAIQEQITESVSLGEQPESSKGVSKGNTQEQEVTKQSKQKEEVTNEKSNPKSAAVNKQVNPPSEVKGEVEQVDNKGEVSETPIKDKWDERVATIDTEKSYTDLTQLKEGDVVMTKTGSLGFVKKINPKKVIIETTYGGQGNNDVELIDLSVNKEDISVFKKPKETASKSTPKSTKTEGEKTAKQNPINEPKNAVGVARIFRKLFNFTPQESILAARLFDAKATFMAKVKGISKEDYYKEYWFGNDVNGGLNQMELNGKTVMVKPMGADVVNGFYSPIEKTINETKFDKLPAKQWADKFAKGEEAKWTGLTDWLNSQTGSVSKADIQQYLKDNRIEIVEVVKGDRSTTLTKDDFKTTNNELGVVAEGNGYTIEKSDNQNRSNPYDLYYDGEYIQENKSIDDAIDRAIRDSRNRKATPESGVKFQQYQIEGEKENYKEVLVTLPRKIKEAIVEKNIEGKFEVIYPDGFVFYGTKVFNTEIEANKSKEEWNRNNKKYGSEQGIKFKSSHFDEPNILVHLRMNTRTDADGNRVLFLEEVQSDWGQKGKKEGFAQVTRLPEGYRIEEPTKWSGWTVVEPSGVDGNLQSTTIGQGATKEEAVQRALDNLNRRKIAVAPFVTDTNAWTKLGLKVALKEAVKQGVSKIAWSTGTQQFDRWGSEEIHWDTIMKPKGFEIVVKDDAKRPLVRGRRIKSLSSNDGSQDQQAEVKRLAEKWNLKPEDLEVIPSKGKWTLAINEQTDAQAFAGNEEALRANKIQESDISVGTKAELRDAIKRNLSRERNDAEIDKLTDRIWNRMQNEDSGTSLPRKEGMEEFYGNPKDMERAKNFTVKKEGELFAVKDEKGKTIRTFKQENEANKFKENYGLGIVGNVAKSLFKQEPKTVDIFQSDKLASGWSVTVKDKQGNVTTNMFDSKSKGLAWLSKQDGVEVLSEDAEGKNYSTQHSIDITPELKAQAEQGQPLFQSRKGSWAKEAAKAKRLISMYQKADSSTAVHEILGHDFLDRIIEASATNKEFEEDLNTIVDEYIKATGSKAKKSVLLNDLKNFDVENNQNANGKAIHEWFAKSAESYMKNEKGAKAGTKLAQVFEKFRKYLSEIYNQMTGDLIPPSKPMVEIFRKAFGTENFDIINEYANEQINETQKDLINNKESKIKLTDEDINEFERLRNEQGLAQDENVVTYEKLFKAALYYKQKGYANVHSIGDELKLLFPSAAKEIDYYLEDFRDIFVPRGERISQTGESAYNSELVDEEVKKELGKRGAYTYKPQSLKVAVNKVKALIDEMGLEQAIEAWKNGDVENNMPESSQPVFAAIVAQRTNALIKQLKKGTRADKEEAKRLSELQSDIIEKHIQKGEEAGRTLNAYKVMAMMSADGIMRFWKKKFNNLNKETKFKLKQQIDELMPKLEKAYKDAEYLFFESASNEELAGRYKEELEQKDKEIAELTKRKANYKPKETVRGGKRNDAKAPKISDTELKERLSRLKKSQGLGQDIESLSDRNAVGYYIIQNKPTGLVKFVKEWNKLTGEKQDVNSLRDLYEEVRDFSVKENYYDSDWFDSDADIDEAVNEYLENKVKVEEQLAKKELEKEILKARNEAFKKQMSDKDKEVKAKDALKKREKEIVGDFLDSLSQEGLWQKYVSANAGKIIGNLSSKIGGKPSEKALLDKFIQLATNEINNAINELTPNQKAAKTTPNYAQQLGDLMANQDKVAEVFDKAISDFAEQHQNDVNAQALLSKLNSLKNPFSEGLLRKALEKEAENYAVKIKDLAFKYVGLKPILKNQIIDQIISETGLTGAEKKALKNDLSDKFDKIISEVEQDTAGQLASAVISDAKKQALNKVGKKDYLTELLGYLKNKAKDTYEKGTTKKLTDPFEQMKYAMEMLNDSNGRKIWEDSQKEIAARIDNDNSLSQTEKDSLKNFLQDYETTLFDQLLSENKLLKNIQKVLIEDGNFVKGNSVDWKGIIVDAKGKPEAVKEIIKGILGDKLTNLGYSQAQIDNMLDAISRKYDNVIKEKKVEIADAQFNKIANPPQRKKKTIAKGKIQNLIEMENSGLLSRSQVEQEIGKWLGVKEMTNQKWAKLRELAEKVEESPEGNERDLAIDEMAAFIRLNSIGRYAEIYAALTYTGMLGRPITTLKNATGIIEPLLTMFYKAFYDPNYAKAMLSYSTRRDFTDVMKGGQVQGSRLDVQVGKDGLPYTNVLKGLSREQGGFFKKLASKAELLTRPLGAFDALSQAMVTGGEDYRQLVEQKIEQGKTLREARREALEEMTNQTTYASSLAEAEKEFAKRGIVPTQARLERRAFEIMRNTYVTDMMKEISTLASLEQAYKSKIDANAPREETNRGIFTLLGMVAQKMVRGLGEGAGVVARGAAKGLGAKEATVKSAEEQTSKIVQMKLMPFIRGISNVMQSGLDKVAGVATGSIGIANEIRNYKPTTPEEAAIKKYMIERHKNQIGKSAATMIIGGLFYYLLLDEDDEEKKKKLEQGIIPNGIYPAGEIKWGSVNNVKRFQIPQASMVIDGRVYPLSYMGTLGIGSLMVANGLSAYKSSQEKEKPKDPNALLDMPITKQIASSTASTILNMSTFQGTSELMATLDPTSTKTSSDYFEREALKSLALAIPFVGTAQQVTNLSKVAAGKNKAQTAIGFKEKAYKELGLDGLMYDRPVVDYRGREIPMAKYNVEGSGGLDAITSKWELDPLDKYLIDIKYNPKLDKRTDIVDADNNAMSKEDYYDYSVAVGKQFGQFLKDNEFVIINKEFTPTKSGTTSNEQKRKKIADYQQAVEKINQAEYKYKNGKIDLIPYQSQIREAQETMKRVAHEFHKTPSLP